MYQLDERLKNDTTCLGQLPLCDVLLHRDDISPWIILVPRVAGITELHHLSIKQQQQLLTESRIVSQTLEALFTPDKLNLALIGNVVAQLHFHHVCRYKSDSCWPAPIWGNTQGLFRDQQAQSDLCSRIQNVLARSSQFVATK